MELYHVQEANYSACGNHTSSGDAAGPVYVGFICAGVGVVFFGSNFVPVKKFETGDGMYHNNPPYRDHSVRSI